MQRQEIFNRVVDHLLVQNERSAEGNPGDIRGRCLYRGPNGTKCAVGSLIPDELYTPALEGGVRHLLLVSPTIAALLGRENESMLNRLQGIHDTMPPAAWPANLAKFAEEYDLTQPASLKVALRYDAAKAAA